MKKVCIIFETGANRLPGHYTQFAFTGLPGVEIAALADCNPEPGNTYLLAGAGKLYSSWREMLLKEKPDIAVLCSRLVDDHFEQIKFALEHNCHVLCEKPLAADLRQADELAELSRRTGFKVQIAHLARFAPAFREMKRLINTGAIGKVVNCIMRGKEDHRGGGEDMMVLGTHLFDAASWIFGAPEEVMAEVRCQGRHIASGEVLPTVEPVGPCGGDEIFARFRFPGGVNGTFESSRLGVPDGEKRMGLTVWGTEGALTLRYTGTRDLRICRTFPVPIEDDADFTAVSLPEPPEIPGAEKIDIRRCGANPENYAVRYFFENNRRAAWDLLQSIEKGTPLTAGVESAKDSLEMISGVYLSALKGCRIKLPLEERRHPLTLIGDF
ncbi:MAG: Gfo/Idh/MocA family oxidoreductase [Lentisphaeria bacterium]|nr:Gfo/Idh/MocA family oxidoreductase [Lentisphaeria bacterium]